MKPILTGRCEEHICGIENEQFPSTFRLTTLPTKAMSMYIHRSSSSVAKPHEGAYTTHSHNGNLISMGVVA